MFRKGKYWKNLIRDMRIWRDFDGKNVAEVGAALQSDLQKRYISHQKNAKAGAWKISNDTYLRMSMKYFPLMFLLSVFLR